MRYLLAVAAVLFIAGCQGAEPGTTTTTTDTTATTSTTSTITTSTSTTATTTSTTSTTSTTTTLEPGSCASTCAAEGYLGGQCRRSGFECRRANEQNLRHGDRFCETARYDTCCCQGPESVNVTFHYRYDRGLWKN